MSISSRFALAFLESLESRCLLSATWYVDADFVPTPQVPSNGSYARPFVKPQDAISAASPGDTISLKAAAATPYARLVVGKSGLTINSYDPQNTTQPRQAKIVAAPGSIAAIYVTPVEEDNAGNALANAAIVQNITIDNLDASGGYYAVKIEGKGPGFEDAKNVTLSNSKLHHSDNDVVKVTPGANFITIENCDIHDSDMSHGGNAEGIDAVNSDYFVLRSSRIWAISTNGVYVKGGSRYTLIENNRVTNVGLGGILLGQDTDNTWFDRGSPMYENIYGVVRNNIVDGAQAAGIGLWAAYRPQVYNNTLLNVARSMQGGLYITSMRHKGAVPTVAPQLFNNIVSVASSSRYAVMINSGALQGGLSADNNLYYQSGAKARFLVNGKKVVDFAGWKSYFGVDQHGLADVSPLLTPDGYLLSGSPAIDRGKPLATWTTPMAGATDPFSHLPITLQRSIFDTPDADIQGNARNSAIWDIGADEYTA